MTELFLISLLTGATGALISIFLTPWVQHFFWKLGRREEIRFAAITEINGLWSAFLQHVILKEQKQDSSLDGEFFTRLDAAATQIRSLFPPDSLGDFEKVYGTIDHGLRPGVAIHEFAKTRQDALQQLYESIGITRRGVVESLFSSIRERSGSKSTK